MNLCTCFWVICSYEVEKLKNIISLTRMRGNFLIHLSTGTSSQIKGNFNDSFIFPVLIHMHYIESVFRSGGVVRTKTEQLSPSVRKK